jgi:hypothetical protein
MSRHGQPAGSTQALTGGHFPQRLLRVHAPQEILGWIRRVGFERKSLQAEPPGSVGREPGATDVGGSAIKNKHARG